MTIDIFDNFNFETLYFLEIHAQFLLSVLDSQHHIHPYLFVWRYVFSQNFGIYNMVLEPNAKELANNSEGLLLS